MIWMNCVDMRFFYASYLGQISFFSTTFNINSAFCSTSGFRCQSVLLSSATAPFYSNHFCITYLRSRMCRLFHSALSSGFASAGPKSDLELIPLGFAPNNHIPATINDSKSAEEVLKWYNAAIESLKGCFNIANYWKLPGGFSAATTRSHSTLRSCQPFGRSRRLRHASAAAPTLFEIPIVVHVASMPRAMSNAPLGG